MDTSSIDSDTRSQAFTLEGIIGSIIILTAVVFALQSVVITPTTGGTVNPEVRAQLQSEANDILVTVGQNRTYGLRGHVRNWSQEEQRFAGAINRRIGYGSEQPPRELGRLLNRTFTQRGRTYNIILKYRKNNSNETGTVPMVFRGQPSDNAVTATYRVTLYDNMTLTAPNSSRVELWRYDTNVTNNRNGYYPIPNAIDGPVYNVVEVRLTVW